MTDLVDLIVDVHRSLDHHGLPHAFGGALALAYVAEPRATIDIDVNVFVPVDEIDSVIGALTQLGFSPEPGTGEPPVAGHRLRSPAHPFPVDVFCNLDERYAEIADRVVRQPFGRGDDVLPFLSPEDLCVFKLSFGRGQDWVDLEKIALARPDIDVDLIADLLVALRGPTMHRRLAVPTLSALRFPALHMLAGWLRRRSHTSRSPATRRPTSCWSPIRWRCFPGCSSTSKARNHALDGPGCPQSTEAG